MFRTFLICIGLMALIAVVIAGAVARAGGEPPAVAAISPTTKARAGAVDSDSKPRAQTDSAPSGDETALAGKTAPAGKSASADKSAPKGGGAQQGNAKSDKTDGDPTGAVKLSGESVVGNQNAPKSLVLVPWKSAEIGKMPGLSMLLDDSVRPVDKDVFMRELAYYRIRAGAK